MVEAVISWEMKVIGKERAGYIVPRSVCEQIKPFLAMDVLAEASRLERGGARVIHLELGQPDFETPEFIKEAAIKATRDGKTGYTPANGILPLREAIAAYYDVRYNVRISPEQVLITQGTSPGLMMLLAALCDKGETVITPDPAYACYDPAIRFAGAESIRAATTEEEGFQLAPGRVRRVLKPNTRAILVNSPSNPGGTLIARRELKELSELGPMLLSDEIYHGLVYEGEAASALEVTGDCCVADGFSKRYAMTGWRLGWIVAPESLTPTLIRLQQNFFLCANSIAQWAGIEAIKHGWPHVERMAAEYDRRRIIMLEGLRKLGFRIQSSPAGAFYILADARQISASSLDLAFDILRRAHVAITPGVDFGAATEGYLRFCYANSVENIEEALARLGKYLESIK